MCLTFEYNNRRFGEQDADLSLEEKMFLRFQKERVKKARNSSLFNLDSGDSEKLTHKGRVLGEGNFDDNDGHSSDEDEKGTLDRDVVNSLHFGGGMVAKVGGAASRDGIYGPPSDAGNETDGQMPRKNRLDALQEIVMKSKLHKLQKKEAKEEQEGEREKLDAAFEGLVSDSLLKFRPTGRDRGEDAEEFSTGNSADFGDYDKSLRAMQFESKARATDRTKTDEELAVEERTRLEELEKDRLKRMKGALDGEMEEEVEVNAALRRGGKAGVGVKRKRAARPITDDDVDGSFGDAVGGGGDGDSEGENENENDDDEEDEDDWEDDEDDNDGEDKAEGGDEEEDEEEDDEEEDEEEEEDNDDEQEEEVEEDEDGKSGKEDNEEESSRPWRRPKPAPRADNEAINKAMPHTLPCPADLDEFDSLVDQHVISPIDHAALIDRILAYHSVHLPGAMGVENKVKMSGFMDVLLRVFVRLGDLLAEAEGGEEEEDELITQVIFALLNAILSNFFFFSM